MTQQPEALRLADALEQKALHGTGSALELGAADELRRLHKENERLKQPRQWQGLTDDEFSHGLQMSSNTSWMKAAKWVEAKLKEKNT